MSGYRFHGVCDQGHSVTLRAEQMDLGDPARPARFALEDGGLATVYPLRVFPPPGGCETCNELRRRDKEPPALTWWQRRQFRRQLDPRNF